MNAPSLTRAPRPAISVLEEMRLPLARVHEICGPARHMLALNVAGALQGPVFWIQPEWVPGRLCPEAVLRFVNPGRLTFIDPKRPEDLLWTMEEALRAGVVPLVVADLPAPPGLTPVRRLHLAAETGAEANRLAPLGLLLTPGDGGAQGVESRWHMAPRHTAGCSAWLLERRRARSDPPRAWTLRDTGGRLLLTPAPA